MTKRTPLYDAHVRHGGKMVEFGGFELPIQYESGLIAEHNAVRHNAGLFDVSHMGEVEIAGEKAFDALQMLVSNDLTGMKEGECRYTLMLNDKGGIVDDFIIYKFRDDYFWCVVNASNTSKDYDWIVAHLPDSGVTHRNLSENYAQVALQGPKADKILRRLLAEKYIPLLNYTFIDNVPLFDGSCMVSRTGYTGEDGFEIYCSPNDVEKLFEKLLELGKDDGLIPCALGCRDTLRFEAGMPLYGHELRDDYLASEVGLGMFVKMDKGDFIGKKALLETPAKYRRRGVKIVDRGIAREGSTVYDGDRVIGVVSTGTHSPTLGYPIAMVRIEKDFKGDFVTIDVRGRRLRAEFVKTPFYKKQI